MKYSSSLLLKVLKTYRKGVLRRVNNREDNAMRKNFPAFNPTSQCSTKNHIGLHNMHNSSQNSKNTTYEAYFEAS